MITLNKNIMISKSLLSDLGLGELSEEDQVLIAEKMTESILKRIVSEFLNELSPEDLKEFENLSDEAIPEEVEGFFRSRISDHDTRITKIIEEYKDEIKGSLESIDNE